MTDDHKPLDQRPGLGLSALVIDDELHLLMLFVELLGDLGFDVEVAATCAAGRARWSAGRFDLLCCDKNLPDGNGLDLIPELRASQPDSEAIVISAYASAESINEALRLGVAEFLVKPFNELREVELRIGRVVERLRQRREVLALRARVAELEAAARRA